MGKKREDNRKTREAIIKVKFLVEGDSEKYYFKEFLKFKKCSISLDIENINGGGYFSFTKNIMKNKKLYDIVIVIADLDKIENENEEKSLKELIELLEKLNIKNNIFLTFKNLETWQKATFPYKVKDLTIELGYRGTSKAKKDIYQRLVNKGATYEIGQKNFKEKDLYYLKKELKSGMINENNKYKVQSNLIYFLEYLKDVLNIKFEEI